MPLKAVFRQMEDNWAEARRPARAAPEDIMLEDAEQLLFEKTADVGGGIVR
jgi:hypothetical protein